MIRRRAERYLRQFVRHDADAVGPQRRAAENGANLREKSRKTIGKTKDLEMVNKLDQFP